MPTHSRHHDFIVLLILALTYVAPACGETENEILPLDAVVIMDSSGSMKNTDPRELRKPAAKLFITLLGEEDRLSVVSFSDNAYPITFLTPLNSERNKQRSLTATDRVSSKGIYTNIHAAIHKGISFLKKSKQQQRDPIIVLMSDGQMDVGDEQRSLELRQKIMDELVPELIAHKIKIYSIAFTEHSDQTLLQEIADATHGKYALAASGDVLHKVFAQIFEQSKEPNMLPLNENRFLIDPSIKEITIVANKNTSESRVLLESPSGAQYSSTSKMDNLKWFVSDSFDMITLNRPEQGEWKILLSDEDNKAYIVADLQLRTRFEYNTESSQPELNIKTWLKQDDRVVTEEEIIRSIELILEIQHPDGQVEEQVFSDADSNGYFLTHYKPTMDGIYSASVIATSKTFERQQIFSFRAQLPEPVIPEPPPTPVEPAMTAQPESEINVTEPNEESGDSLLQAVMIFMIVNVVIIFIALNAFLIYRMRKNKST